MIIKLFMADKNVLSISPLDQQTFGQGPIITNNTTIIRKTNCTKNDISMYSYGNRFSYQPIYSAIK